MTLAIIAIIAGWILFSAALVIVLCVVSSHRAMRAAASLTRRGERHVKPYQCGGCGAWHVGHDWARIKHEDKR